MRIIAGQNRGLRLAEVGEGDAAAALRPTSDRLRETIFNLLEGGRYGTPVREAVVLDLFAGTGALGLEALSRGAEEATFVESGRVGQRLIRENLKRASRGGEARLLAADALKLPAREGAAATLIFLDPPYGRALGAPALAAARAGGWVAPEALVVWEEAAPQPPPPGFTLAEHRRAGVAHLTLLRAAG
ncbi:RsmD family RNA methyltransferase [Pseudoroseicyclus tamaricis]|uniref:16S rRNA (Guanine(966)-N(2))-methyltransferase RsmD n=1 Tax=Pseudoroseicyclus tamaricis TaxID=2705421 RepID=A0A6B2JWJ6_9RHOB|nr:RsmD family RNA methyltransferase [Pseudoroseicyclus tamaricis]NDV02877.1 16S rRNA (guanine(966)-N(2))-methyltransferase RsmD [Pseudoroseicyclus tamaricis]